METANQQKNSNGQFVSLMRGRTQTSCAQQVIIEMLHGVGEPIIKEELRKMTMIRRGTFLKVLKYLIANFVVIKVGTGRKRDPYKYVLSETYQQAPSPQLPQGIAHKRRKFCMTVTD